LGWPIQTSSDQPKESQDLPWSFQIPPFPKFYQSWWPTFQIFFQTYPFLQVHSMDSGKSIFCLDYGKSLPLGLPISILPQWTHGFYYAHLIISLPSLKHLRGPYHPPCIKPWCSGTHILPQPFVVYMVATEFLLVPLS
jgi:hypothetical protein